MSVSLNEQFVALVRQANRSAHAYLCDGDSSAAMVWDDTSEITVRLSLRGTEIWLFAGSGTLIRFVAASDGEFDHEGIGFVIDQILRGVAIEFFGVADGAEDDHFATGFEIGPSQEFAGGLAENRARLRTRLAGPMARAALPLRE